MKLQRKAEIIYTESPTINSVNRYFRNLWLALLGNNPYQMEMIEAMGHLEMASKSLRDTQDMCHETMDRWGESQKQLTQMQQLVETLRDHLREKDEQLAQLCREHRDCMEQMRRDHEKHQ